MLAAIDVAENELAEQDVEKAVGVDVKHVDL
jgi:hypothetical protein